MNTQSAINDVNEHTRISHASHTSHASLPYTEPTIQQQRYETDLQHVIDHTTVTKTGVRDKVYIGTRDSNLAMWQANHVHSLIEKYINTIQYNQPTDNNTQSHNNQSNELQPNPTIAIDSKQHEHPITLQVVGMKTLGDLALAQPLNTFSNKGVFTKELDIALLNGSIDCAVHCMKDLPTTLPTGISIAATLERGTIEDAVIMHQKHIDNNITTLDQLAAGSIIGTSALRRIATLNKYYPHLTMHDVRGNVNTRLSKLDSGAYDALILAATGLERINLQHRITCRLDAATYGHAVGQGALTILVRSNDTYMHTVLHTLNDIKTDLACTAERALMRTLQGGCKVPITVHSTYHTNSITDNQPQYITLQLHAGVLSVNGKQTVENTLTAELKLNDINDIDDTIGNRRAAIQLGNQLGELLLNSGADVILQEIHQAEYTQNPQQKPNKTIV